MRWLFDNPQLLFLVAGAIAYWLNQRRKEKQTGKEMEEELARTPTDEEMAERTRRVQEEIRRKIAERQGQTPVAPPRVPVETVRPAPRPAVPPPLPAPQPVAVSIEESPGAAELERVMAEQRRYAEQLDRLAAAERASQAATPGAVPITMAVYETSAAGRAAAPTVARGERLLASLRSREELRRAFVLREVLGAPKALQ